MSQGLASNFGTFLLQLPRYLSERVLLAILELAHMVSALLFKDPWVLNIRNYKK